MTEEEKKRLLQMAKNASKQNPTQAFNRVQSQLQQKVAEQKKQQAAAQKASSTQKSSNPVNTIRKDTTVRKASASSSSSGSQQQSNGIRFAADMPGTGLGTLDSLGGSSAADRRQSYLQGGSVRRRTNTDSRTGTNTSRGTQREADERNLQLNMIRWHNTTDPAERSRLNQENSAIRQRLGLSYDPRTGVTYNARTGRNYSAPTQAVFGGTVVDRMRQADQWRQSRMTAGQNEEQTSVRAHQVMNDLFSRSAEEWTEEDTRSRDEAVKALSDEMDRILERYGMQYNVRETGPNARFFVSDSEAVDRLRQAGADETTLAYVQENINQRQAADRLGQGFEAVAKRAIGSIPALFETGQQQAENVEQSRQNPEFVQLEQEERQLESQLTSIPSTNYDGSLNQDYLEIYNRLQSVRERKNQLAVQTPVDQSKWGQTMLREAAEAQANATAGLATVPRFLANTGISIAGNAPGMAASLIPGAGPVVGAGLMGASAAGQRAQELSAEGASPSEALGRGIVSGIIEAVTEKLPIDTLADILNRGGTDAVRSILRQMGIEAGEESASYMMNLASDWAAADPNAQFSFADLAEQALGGAISGGVYGGAGTLIGRTGAQTAQETAAAPRVENYSPVMQETVRGDLGQTQQTAPETAQVDSQALGQQLAELDSAMRTAENLLPGPARDARIAEIRAEMEQVQAETAEPTTVQDSTGQMTMREFQQQQRQAQAARDFASAGEPIQAEQSATTTVNVPVTAAIQYGATPQQAMREAEVRAQGEAAQAARETQLSQDIRQSNPTMRPDNPYFGLSRQQLEMERDFARQRLERARSDRRPERAQSMQTQLDQIEAALEDAQQHDFKRGDRVFALDRNNFGEIIDDRGDGYFDVYFVNGQTGENGIHTLHGDLLQSIVPGEDVPRLTPQDAAEITGDITDYGPEEFDRIVSEAPDQYEAMPKRDLSRFGGGRLRGGEEQMQKDIEAMTEEADQQGAKQIVPESVARNISPVHMAYNKTLERVLDEAAGVSETIRTFFRDTIEKPLAYAKGLYARNIKTQMDDYYKAMQETGIRLGSKESAAVMWYGEGQRVNEKGDIEKYTLEHLKRDFPKKWKDIVKADSVNRRIYDEYIQKIQKARREVYPYAEQRVELAINRRRAQIAALSEQVKNLDAKIKAGSGTAADQAARSETMRELKRLEKDLSQKIKDRDSGKAFANQRLFPRKDFYHHTMEMAQGFSALKNILDVDSNIDPRLVGKSDNTKPNAKWSGILQRRRGVNALEDSVAAMLDYIPQAEYMINIDPQVARMRTIVRDIVDGTANADQTNANSLIEWLTDYTNDLAGKTNPFDRALQKWLSRKAFKTLEWLNGRAKSNAILGNLNSALSQVYNLPNGLAYIHDPRDISAGLVDFAAAKAGNDRAKNILQSSNFLTERYLDKAQKQFDESLMHKPKQFAEWLMTAGDEQVAQMIYFSAYEQALRRGEADPVFYADDITRRAIAGRGVGEVPLLQKSKWVKLIAPFQVEVSNAYYVIKEKIGARDALGLTLLFLSTFLLNELKEDLTGTRTGMDLIDAGSDAIKEVLDPEYEGNTLNKMLTVATRLGGEVLSNMPFGSQIASTLVPDETRRTKLFGESDPTRFGTGNIGINALLEPVGQFLSGQEVNPWDPLTNLVMPWGGRQASRVVDMAEDYGLLPIFRISQDGVRADRQDVQASYSDDGSRLRFPMDTDIGNILKGLAFGRYATDAGKAYIEGGLKMLSEDKTAAFTRGVTEQGIDEATLYDVIVKIGQAEPVKDAEGNTLTSSKQVARRMLFDREDLTAEQKRWIDEQLLIDPDSDQQPADYTDYNTFMLYNIRDSRKDAARDAIATGLSIDQFVQWDDRLSEMIGEKDENDKKVRTEAEARNIVLDEVMQDSTLSDSEKQALADYVLISSIGEEDEKARKNWETIAKGKVNASDFVRFQADASVYDAWAEGTGTDNAANVAEILRGYDGLTDEQRDVLFQTYRDNMSVNPFHVSVYEKSIDPNGSFYGALTDDGKARLRSLLNEYEQDINEGAELDEWRAKAYMAEKEAGISPATYAMYRVALETANTDDKGNPRQSEAEACVNAMDGLTQYQKAYLYASTNKSWKNNPFGSATVGEYSSGQEVGINPVAGATVTSRFGPRKSFQTDNGAMSSSLHPSIDIGAAEGTPIGAYKSGKVTQNGWVNGYGWTIEVTHSDGTVSAYHHMMEQSPVAVGTEVKQGEQIGKVGQTGNSKGAHLDLTITRDGKPIDPATLIPELQDSATGYVWTGSNVYTNVTSGSGQSNGSSGGGSGSKKKSGFSSNPFDSFDGFKGF